MKPSVLKFNRVTHGSPYKIISNNIDVAPADPVILSKAKYLCSA